MLCSCRCGVGLSTLLTVPSQHLFFQGHKSYLAVLKTFFVVVVSDLKVLLVCHKNQDIFRNPHKFKVSRFNIVEVQLGSCVVKWFEM